MCMLDNKTMLENFTTGFEQIIFAGVNDSLVNVWADKEGNYAIEDTLKTLHIIPKEELDGRSNN